MSEEPYKNIIIFNTLICAEFVYENSIALCARLHLKCQKRKT